MEMWMHRLWVGVVVTLKAFLDVTYSSWVLAEKKVNRDGTGSTMECESQH